MKIFTQTLCTKTKRTSYIYEKEKKRKGIALNKIEYNFPLTPNGKESAHTEYKGI